MSHTGPTQPPPPKPPVQPPRGYQRPVPRRGTTLKDWLVSLPALAVTAYVFVSLVRAGRLHPTIAYVFVAIALLALAFDILMLVKGHSMVLVIGMIFGTAAVVSLVPQLVVGIPLAVLAAAGYVGLMLLIGFRKRA